MKNTDFILDDSLLLPSGKRFLNFVLDKMFMMGILFLILVVLAFFVTTFHLEDLNKIITNISDFQGQVFFIFFGFFYYLLQESIFGTTLGKIVSGAIVVDENGNKPSFISILKRTLSRLIPLEGLSYLGERLGWHDAISNTYVVNKKELLADKKKLEEINTIGNIVSN